jgi:hypothetical protein
VVGEGEVAGRRGGGAGWGWERCGREVECSIGEDGGEGRGRERGVGVWEEEERGELWHREGEFVRFVVLPVVMARR